MTDFRVVNHNAPDSAPRPDAPIRNPSVSGPPPRISSANTGINTENGIATRHSQASCSISERMGRNPSTYRQPSTRWSTMRGCVAGRWRRRTSFMASSAMMTAK
ncbi:hypothetical protein D3C83_36940 [compost metagenome]